TQVNSPEGVVNHEYDPVTGQQTRTCTQNSQVDYGYDQARRLETVQVLKRNGSAVTEPPTQYTYTAVGSRHDVTLPNGTVTTYTYDGLNRLTDLEHKASDANATVLAHYHYDLHDTGRRRAATETLLNTADSTYTTRTLGWQ